MMSGFASYAYLTHISDGGFQPVMCPGAVAVKNLRIRSMRPEWIFELENYRFSFVFNALQDHLDPQDLDRTYY
jgi:hypothetical protein